jgi:hypothetical protein
MHQSGDLAFQTNNARTSETIEDPIHIIPAASKL